MIGVDWMPGREHGVRVGDRVAVKYDLSRRNDGVWWTVEHKGLVVAHVRGVALRDVTPKVSAATQARWAGVRRKPCAWLVGTLADDSIACEHGRVVSFDFHSGNPWFSLADTGERFAAASAAVFSDRARVVNP